MNVFYNEIDPKAAAWLRELIRDGHIPYGFVDERSIEDVRPDELVGYTQCHFFAGIGGWPLALRLAGWPDDRPVWTGSCPCQPFSQAGARKGTDDPRHLWPAFRWLIDQCRPTAVFGEQVASAAGRGWLAGVRADLEAMGYGVGAADLCAASVGAPHIRQRLFWVADADPTGSARLGKIGRSAETEGWLWSGSADSGIVGRVADTQHAGHNRSDSFASEQGSDRAHGRVYRGGVGGLANAEGRGFGIGGVAPGGNRFDDGGSECGGVEHANGRGRTAGHAPPKAARHRSPALATGWDDFIWIDCADGKQRRIEPGIAPLAHGIPARVVRLRGYGNAIVPQVAAQFVRAAGAWE